MATMMPQATPLTQTCPVVPFPLAQPPRVYSPQHIEQLAAVNQLTRQLRDIGITVHESHLSLAESGRRPWLRIAAPNPALLALGSGLVHQKQAGAIRHAVLVAGMDVVWLEPRP